MPFKQKNPDRPLNSYFQLRLNREQEEDVWKACAATEGGSLGEWMRHWLNFVTYEHYKKLKDGRYERK